MAEISGRGGAVYSNNNTVLLEDCEDGWPVVNATLAAIDTDSKVGTYSVKIEVPDIGTNLNLAYDNITGVDISGTDVLYLWVKDEDIGLSAGDCQILLASGTELATTLRSLDIPALTINTWTRVLVDFDTSGLTNIRSVGAKQVTDLAAHNLFVDDIRTLGFIDGMRAWTLDLVLETLEVTDFEDGQSTDSPRAYVPALSGWSGTFDGFKDGVPVGLGFGASIILALSESQTSGQAWIGDAYITGIHPNVSVDGVVTYSYDFQGTGALEKASV